VAVTLIGFTVWTLRSDAIRDESSDIGNIATVLAEQTSRSLLAVDLVLTEIQGQPPIDFKNRKPANGDPAMTQGRHQASGYALLERSISTLL
jgi:hypothetical protein